MKKNKFLFALVLPIVALTGCATTYTQEGIFTNGYSDYRTAPDIFVVTFRASEHTPAEKVMEYALKRSAEVTRNNGFKYFSVVEKIGSKRNLHYPSLRLTIKCYHSQPIDREWIDAHTLR